MPGPVRRRREREGSAPPRCRKTPHFDAESAVLHMLSLIRAGKSQPERGLLHYYLCDRCWNFHVGHTRRR